MERREERGVGWVGRRGQAHRRVRFASWQRQHHHPGPLKFEIQAVSCFKCELCDSQRCFVWQ